MGSGKNETRRKKRVSKHVLKAREKHEAATVADSGGEQTTPAASVSQKSSKSKAKKKNKKVKDPSEAASYLSAWKHRDSGPGVWKFNKNEQSWLIRHMYDPEKVPKTTFSILTEYLQGLQGNTATRTLEEATQRAVRYKNWEKTNNSQDETTNKENTGSSASAPDLTGDMPDHEHWTQLDDHGKRKEYKRARVIIDVLKTHATAS